MPILGNVACYRGGRCPIPLHAEAVGEIVTFFHCLGCVLVVWKQLRREVPKLRGLRVHLCVAGSEEIAVQIVVAVLPRLMVQGHTKSAVQVSVGLIERRPSHTACGPVEVVGAIR
jgi:hypothetical protein